MSILYLHKIHSNKNAFIHKIKAISLVNAKPQNKHFQIISVV